MNRMRFGNRRLSAIRAFTVNMLPTIITQLLDHWTNGVRVVKRFCQQTQRNCKTIHGRNVLEVSYVPGLHFKLSIYLLTVDYIDFLFYNYIV